MYVCSAAEKALIINILDILKKYSDKNHRLSQKDIIDILDKEYCMKIDRKTVKRNLIEFGYAIEYSESIRLVKDKNGEEVESKILSDFYINRPFTDGELRLLIDSVLFSNHISYSQCRDLVEKLEGLSNIYFRSRVKHIRNLPENQPSNSELFMTIETLDKAISRGLQVSFTYNSYDIDKKLDPRRTSNNEVRNYIINPYQIVATNGRYYLVWNYDKNINNTTQNFMGCPKKRVSDFKFQLTHHRNRPSVNTTEGFAVYLLSLSVNYFSINKLSRSLSCVIHFSYPQHLVSSF